MNSAITRITTMFILLVCMSNCLKGQVLSKSISNRGASPGYTELQVIKTDAVLKQAKKTVPADVVFFLELKRKFSNIPGRLTGTRTVTEVSSSSRGTPKPGPQITNTTTIKDVSANEGRTADVITGLTLFRIYSNTLVAGRSSFAMNPGIYATGNPAGDVYQSGNRSETLFVRLGNLMPNNRYELEITWRDGGSEVYYLTTTPSSMTARAEQRLFAQFGVAAVVFKNDTERFTDASFMVAVNYNLRPVNRNLPLRVYEPWALQRFSIQLGLTTTSLERDNVTEDLFGDNNVLLGLSYQPIDWIRLTYGSMIFREVNVNRLISNQSEIKGTSYFSVSLDLRLQPLLGGVFGKLGL